MVPSSVSIRMGCLLVLRLRKQLTFYSILKIIHILIRKPNNGFHSCMFMCVYQLCFAQQDPTAPLHPPPLCAASLLPHKQFPFSIHAVCVCIYICTQMCTCAHTYTHLNIDPEEVHAVFEIFCDVLFEVPRMAEDKVEKNAMLGHPGACLGSSCYVCWFSLWF